MPTNEGFSGVLNCYVFKSRLQEYAQKVGLPTPVYETIKEGPSHEPCFKSTVIVSDVRYDSLPGFYNRKAAEQSAAEVALVELVKHGEVNQRISQPVHETGLCKNLLQEYAQKMNYAIPLYQCRKDEAPGKVHFTCTVEIGGIQYIGAAAKAKKEAEIKAARTALLAIQELSGKSVGNSQLTVIPCRKRGAVEMCNNAEEAARVPKAKKCRFKKMLKKKRSGGRAEHTEVQRTGNLVNVHADHKGSKVDQTNTSGFQLVRTELLATEAIINCQEGRSHNEPIQREVPDVNDALSHCFGGETGNSESVHSAAANCNHSSNVFADIDTFSVPFGFTTALAKKVNDATPDAGESSVSYESTTALARESNEATPDAVATFVSYEPTTASAKGVNEVTGVMGAASMMNSSTTALAKESNDSTSDLCTFSMSYEPTTPLAKEFNKTTGVMEAGSMMNSSTAAFAKESNKVNYDVGSYSKSYEPTIALAKELNGPTAVMDATSPMNNSILGQVESSSCIIPGVNQAEETVQAGTSQA